MELADVTKKLEQYASTKLAAEWDNVGLLLEPSPPHYVSKLLLTNDLTEPVLDEAIETSCNLIVSYHPPIFSAIKKLRQSRPTDRIAVRCLENRIAVYSPHTAYDALKGGVNDWLVSAFDATNVSVLEQSYSNKEEYQVEIPYDGSIDLINAVESHALETTCSSGRLTARCLKNDLRNLVSALERLGVLNRASVFRLEKLPLPEHGMGRLVTLAQPLQISEVVRIVKDHLGVTYVRLAIGRNSSEDTTVRTIAACAGSGGSLLRGVAADVLLTGEMSHHEILEAVNNNITVVLCEHCNTERGFLVILQQQLANILGNAVEVIRSRKDRCPIVLA